MAELLPKIAEIDFNPVIATDHSVTIPDSRIRVQPREPTDPLPAGSELDPGSKDSARREERPAASP